MNKRLRSRVLAASMVSSTVLGSVGLLAPQVLLAQDKPSAAAELDRGSKLYQQKQYSEAKRILVDIDPAQLPEDLRAKRADLIKNTDMELAKTAGPNGAFDAAQANLDGDKLATAAASFQAIIDDPAAPADVKDRAKVQLAVVKEKQAAKAPAMKELLNQAESLYKAGNLDESQNALTTVQATGSDLGWKDRERPAALQAKINETRMAKSRTETPAPGAVVAPPMTNAATVDAGTTGSASVAPPAGAPVTGIAPANPDDPLSIQTANDAVNRERALTHYNMALDQSTRDIKQNPPAYDAAIAQAKNAVGIIDENRRFFSETEAAAYRDSAQRQADMIGTQKAAFDALQKQQDAIKAAQAESARQQHLKAEKEHRVHLLMEQAQHFINTQQYKEAADIYRQVLVTDPTNDPAKLLLQYTTDRINYRAYQDITNQRALETARQNTDGEEHIIPYTDLLIYPGDWVELTRNRVGDQSNVDTPANRAVRERLDEPLKEITAEQQGFEKVINFLRDNTGTNIFVNWTALQAAGIDRNTPVSVNLHEVPFRKALTTVLSDVGGGSANLGYTIDDGVITISTRDDLNSAKYQVVRVFDIRDMLVQPDSNIKPPNFDLTAITQNGSTSGGSSGGGGGGGSSQSLFTDTGAGAGATTKSRDDIVKDIIETIKTTVAPESWRDAGGQIGSLRELNGQLIVNQTVDNQSAVFNLLQQLRETRSLEISIEARILLVSNNFFDQLGFDWSLGLAPGLLGGSSGAFTISNGATSTLATPPGTGVPGSITGFGGAGTNALNITGGFGSILDNFTLNIVIAATQVDQRAITVDAPRVTLFNGQKGYIAVTEQQNFVSNFNQTVSSGTTLGGAPVVGTNLTVSTLNTGIVLFVEATVSADRRYVVMKVRPQLASLEGLQTFSSGGVQNPTFSFGGGGFVQLPKIRFTTVDTMVSVPDGGTLLIGGEKIVGESEIEIGVPVLSKIPGLQRLFTNRAVNKDERTLLILVRPRIIIQKEIENNLFGPGYDRPTGLPNPNAGAGMLGNGFGPGFSVDRR